MLDGGEAATPSRNNRGFGLRKLVVVSRFSGNVTRGVVPWGELRPENGARR